MKNGSLHETMILASLVESIVPFQELFVRYGGKLLARHRVTGIIPGDLITVQTDKGSFEAKKVIITAGAWTGQLVEGTGLTLPLQVTDRYHIHTHVISFTNLQQIILFICNIDLI